MVNQPNESSDILPLVMDTQPKLRRTVTRNEILQDLRRKITHGDLLPGDRLPTHRELKRQMSANIVTLGRAISQLKLEGFVETRGSRGTFVSESPPHLCLYALVFPSHSATSNWPRFWEALAKESERIERGGVLQMPIYYDIANDLRSTSPDFDRLLEDVHAHRVAGLIFASHPWVVENTPFLTEPGIPRVALMPPQSGTFPHVGVVMTDHDGLIERALDFFVSKGRKRLGVMTTPSVLGEGLLKIRQKAAARGLETRPYWMQSVSETSPRSAQATMHLMMSGKDGERPDAIFVTDDNLVEYATAGILDARVRVPSEVEVVVHCNFPWPVPSIVPVRRIGFDARQLIAACVRSIDQQRATGTIPPPVAIPAQFEDELT